MDQELFEQLGITAQAAEQLEKTILVEALTSAATRAGEAATEPDNVQGLVDELLAAQQEAEAVAVVLAAQREQADNEDWNSSDDEATKEVEHSNRELEAAIMRQRLDQLLEQKQQLQQQISQLPTDQQQAAVVYQQQQEALWQEQQLHDKQQGRRRGQQRGAQSSSSSRPQPFAGQAANCLQDSEQQQLLLAGRGGAAPMKFVETERDRLIRIGLLTPFDRLEGFERKVQGGNGARLAVRVNNIGFQGGGTSHHQQQQEQQQGAQHKELVQQQGQPRGQNSQQHQAPQQVDKQTTPAAMQPPTATSAAAAPAPPVPAAVDEQWALLQQRAAAGATGSRSGAAVNASDIADSANDIGPGGLPLSELVARTTQKAVEIAVTNRPRAMLMSEDQVPRQERDIVKVDPTLWRAGGMGSKVEAKRPPRRSTLPKLKRQRKGLSLGKASKRRKAEDSRSGDSEQHEWDGNASSDAQEDRQGLQVEPLQDNMEQQPDGTAGTVIGADSNTRYWPSDADAAGSTASRKKRLRRADSTEAAAAEPGADGVGQERSRKRKSRSKSNSQGTEAPTGSTIDAASADAHALDSLGELDDSEQSDEQAERDELADFDDVDEEVYQLRLERFEDQQQQRLKQQQQQQQQGDNPSGSSPAKLATATATAAAATTTAAAAGAAAGAAENVVFDGGFHVPGSVWSQLFDYQRTGVKWLWELHTQRAGGIIGDEMGLGKTIQVIAYLAGLHASGMWRPGLIVAPATVLRQWLSELRTWYPPLRVMLLHDSGRSPYGRKRPHKAGILDIALSASGCSLVLTTYEQLRLLRDLLLPVRWGVAVLDEGHKIRNPDAEVTLAAKQLQTVHRLIMSGSPIQNRLSELWSLFDFIFPGKLGTLPVFTAQFAIPITIGGYTNASKLQVQTAYRCAVVLRDLISPYLLRRRKADVATQLPKKTETVLFCRLTEEQRDLYRAYLHSNDVSEILSGRRQALAGIDVLRKICNHPDLLERTTAQGNENYGEPSRSGKFQVLAKVLAAWHTEGHKVLLFTQTQQMLDIIEKHVVSTGYSYHRMDGGTAVAHRGRLIDDFNTNLDRFVFLLTTKVGGLGVNLTGANRVIIYDPDWNPSTDSQARERAWRIGQGRPVTIYRLITSGTIEEKVYHRQIYKSYLTNKVLQDPRQRRFFASHDISDLFTLADEHGGTVKRQDGGGSSAATAGGGGFLPDTAVTETARIFSDIVGEQQMLTPAMGAATAAAAASKKPPLHGNVKKPSSKQQQAALEAAGAGPTSRKHKLKRAAAAVSDGADNGSSSGDGAAAAEDDASVLRDLFEGAGIKSLMDHTSIETANDPEMLKADAHAAKVAAQAAEVLRQSRLACQAAAVNVPTWTGRHGAAGGPGAAAARASPAAGGSWGGSSSSNSHGRFGRVTNSLLTAPLLSSATRAGGRVAAAAASDSREGVAGVGAQADAIGPGEDTNASPAPSAAGAGSSSDASLAPGNSAAGAGGVGEWAFSGRIAGTSGAAAPSSAALLARLRERQAAAAAATAAGDFGSAAAAWTASRVKGRGGDNRSSSSADRHSDGVDDGDSAVGLAAQIVSFIQAAGSSANSELLLNHFREILRDSDMPLFKQLLRRVARLEPAVGGSSGGSGRGGGRNAAARASKVWVLRDDYTDGGA